MGTPETEQVKKRSTKNKKWKNKFYLGLQLTWKKNLHMPASEVLLCCEAEVSQHSDICYLVTEHWIVIKF